MTHSYRLTEGRLIRYPLKCPRVRGYGGTPLTCERSTALEDTFYPRWTIAANTSFIANQAVFGGSAFRHTTFTIPQNILLTVPVAAMTVFSTICTHGAVITGHFSATVTFLNMVIACPFLAICTLIHVWDSFPTTYTWHGSDLEQFVYEIYYFQYFITAQSLPCDSP